MNIYVYPTGNDNIGNGSLEKPFCSLERAVTEIESLRKSNRNDIIEVYVNQGNYSLSQPLMINEKHNNTKIIAVGNVELKGTITLDNIVWHNYALNDKIKVAQIDRGLDIDGFYVNSEHQIMARYPNYTEGVVPLGGATSEENIKERIKNYKSVEGGYIRAIHSYGWGGNSYIITGRDEALPLGLSLKWVGDNNRGSEYNKEMLVIENIFEELDAPNEWYYDKKSGELFYYPAVDINLNNATFEVAVNSDIIKINGAENVTFDGFSFAKTSRTMFTVEKPDKQYVPLLRGDWAVVRSGAVLIENSKNINIINSEFKEIYGNAIFISGKNLGHRIDNNEFHNIGASCVQVVGLDSSVYEPSFWERKEEGFEETHTIHKTTVEMPDKVGPKTDEFPIDIVISNNHMHKMGIYEKQSCGVNISMSKNVQILNNTIHNSARSCININDGTFGGHIIANNDIFDSQRETTDHGPFNSWGRDRFWSVPQFDCTGLFGKEKKSFALLDVVETIKIHNNRFHHDSILSHSWGIDLDDGSSNYEIYNNLCLGIGVKLREGFKRRVYNNIIVGGQFQIHCTYEGADDQIESNIIINSNPWGFAGQAGGSEKRLKDGKYRINNNWYYNNGEEIEMPDFWEQNGYDENCIINENPQFKDVNENDYTVTNTAVIENVKFCNFNMSAFGKPNCKYKSPIFIQKKNKTTEDLNETLWNGAIISNINHAIMSATATNGTNGVYFKEVPENCLAYELGYRTNKVIKEINGKDIANVEDFIAFYKINN